MFEHEKTVNGFDDICDWMEDLAILRDLRDLVKVTINLPSKSEASNWKSVFGIEWECIEYEIPNEQKSVKLVLFKI